MPLLPPPHAPRPPAHQAPLHHASPVLTARVDLDVISSSALRPFDSLGAAPHRTPIPKRPNARPSPTSAARVAQAPPRARVNVSSLSSSPGRVANVGAGPPTLRARRSITSISSAASPSHSPSPAARPGVRKAQSSTMLSAKVRASPSPLPPLLPTPPSMASARSRARPGRLSPGMLGIRTPSFPGPVGPASGTRPPWPPAPQSPTTVLRSPTLMPPSPATSSSRGATDRDSSPSCSRIPTAIPTPGHLRRSSVTSAPSSVSSGSSKPLASIPQGAPFVQVQADVCASQNTEGLRADTDVGADIDAEEEAKKVRKILDLEITNRSLLAINEALEVAKIRHAEEIRELKRRLRAGVGLGPASSGSLSSEEEEEEKEDESEAEEDAVLAALNGRCAVLVEQMTSRARAALAFEPVRGHVGTGGKVLHPCEVAGLVHGDEEIDAGLGSGSLASPSSAGPGAGAQLGSIRPRAAFSTTRARAHACDP